MTDDRWSLPTPPGFRLAPTVLSHGAFQCPPFHWDPGKNLLTRVLRLPDVGARVVEIEEEMVESVEVMRNRGGGVQPKEVRKPELRLRTPGWSPGEDLRVEVEEAVVFMLALDRSLHEFHELCRGERALSRIPEIGAGRLLRCPRLWEELAKVICGSAAPWDRAVSMIERIAELGETVDGLHAWPEPARVVEAGESHLRRTVGLDEEAPHLIELARRIESGALDPAPAEAGLLDRDELADLFRSVPGIDEETARHLLMLYGHAEQLPMNEAAVAFLRDRHFGGRAPTAEEVRTRYERYGEWKALAYWFDFVQQIWWPSLGVEL